MFKNIFHRQLINRALKLLLVTNGLILVAGSMLGPIYALFVEEIGGDILAVGSAWAVYAGVAGVTIILISKFEDKIKDKELFLILGYLIIGISFLGYLFVDSKIELLIVQAFIGFGEALYAPAFDALYSEHLSRKARAFGWGLWESMNYIVTAIGALVGSIIVFYFGFSMLFILMAALAFIAAIIVYLTPRKVI